MEAGGGGGEPPRQQLRQLAELYDRRWRSHLHHHASRWLRVSVDLRHSIYRRKGRKGWTLEYREAGVSTQRTCPRRTDAEAAWTDVVEERRRRAGLRTAIPTFRDYSRRWLTGLAAHLRPSSLLKYKWALGHLDPLAAHTLDAIDRETVRTLLAEKATTLAPATAGAIANVLHTCLAEAVADGYLRTNPADGGGSLRKRRKERARPKALDPAQLRALLANAGQWHDLFYTQWVLGLRPGEAIGLQPADVDFARQCVRIERTVLSAGGVGPPKGGETGWVDLAPGGAAILQPRVTADGEWLFSSPRGGPYDHVTVERNFKRIAAAAGLPDHLTPHCLRHTFAVMLLKAGASIYYVQRMLRHKSISVTVDVYGWCLDPGRPELAAAMEVSALGTGEVANSAGQPLDAVTSEAEHHVAGLADESSHTPSA